MLVKDTQSLKIKIILLLSTLIIIITSVLTLLCIENTDKLVDSNIELFSTTFMKNEKEELHNKIDLGFNVINMYYEQTKPEYIEKTVRRVLISHQEQLFSQLYSFYTLNKNKYSDTELKNKLKCLVQYARYGKNGYFWINNMDNKMIMHPIKPQYNNHYFINDSMVPFVSLGVKKLKKTQKDEVFIKYRFYNPATQKYDFKVSLVKIFKPFGWVIGTGSYLSDITPLAKAEALKNIQALRYGKNGYFWINDINYKMIMHPIKPHYNGKVFIHTKKVPFVELGVNALKKSMNDIAIIKYNFYNPATQKYERKLSIVKIFRPWNWIIGTGVYLNTVDNSIAQVEVSKNLKEKEFIVTIILLGIFIILFTLVIAYFLIVHFIVNPINTLTHEKEYFEEISQIDYLTKILNRRAFFEEANKYLAYARRNNLSVSVMMIDIDHFKNINDTYGHEAGDFVLKELAKIIGRCIREEDIFGRIGGEEFGISILNTKESTLCTMAQKIREAIEKSVISYKEHRITFTISIGGYKVESTVENFDIALNKADQALYTAKNTGRNKVTLFNKILCS